MVNINSLPGPDQGLVDAIFGQKTVAPEISGQPAEMPADFQKLLAQAQTQSQDQKEVANTAVPQAVIPQAAAPQTKDGKVTGQSPMPEKTAKLEKAEAALEQKPAAKKTGASKEEILAAALQASAGQSSAQAAAPMMPKASAEPATQVEVTAKPVKPVTVEALPSSQQQKPQQQQPVQMAKAEVAQPKAVVTSVAAMAAAPVVQETAPKGPKAKPAPIDMGSSKIPPIMESAVKAQAPVAAPAPVAQAPVQAVQAAPAAPVTPIVQPIVIAMPMPVAMPVAMQVEDDGEGFAGSAVEQTPLRSSQEFLAGREMMLSKKERAAERESIKASQWQTQDSSQSQQAQPSYHLLVPQVAGHKDVAMAPMATKSNHLQMTHNAVHVQDTTALTGKVWGLAAKGGGSMKLKLEPEHLGELTISVQNRAGQLDVRFEAASREAKEAIAAALPELKQTLTASRYEVGNIEVSTSSSSGAISAGSLSLGNQSSGLSSWMSSENPMNGNGNGSGNQQWNDSGRDSAWDRYFSQSDQQSPNQHGGGRQGAYRRYEQYAMDM